MKLDKQHCPHCNKQTTFNVLSFTIPENGEFDAVCSECGNKVNLTNSVTRRLKATFEEMYAHRKEPVVHTILNSLYGVTIRRTENELN